jgi:hypothetical protein
MTGGTGTPGPAKSPLEAEAANITTVRINIRIAIFMINFLQYLSSSEFFAPKVANRLHEKSKRGTRIKNLCHFSNSPAVNKDKVNQFHTADSVPRLTTNN